jgi:tRNA dimethylallyltransferase
MSPAPETVLIAGPTASGKSAFAINYVAEHGLGQGLGANAVIFNADSMQVYDHLQILTARPSVAQLAEVPHLLYGHRDPAQPYSVAAWLEEVAPLLEKVHGEGKTAIFVGGTGLYFKGLTEGLSPVPLLDEAIRQKWRNYSDTNSLHDELAKSDAAAALKLRPSDHQRIIRALEVIDSTGKSILDWQSQDKGSALIVPGGLKKILLMPERSLLHQRINERFERMVEEGALSEVKAFMTHNIDASMPAMKAIGVRQINAHLKGELSLEEAIEKSKAATRQYAKRQSTWFNNQFGADWQRL